MGEPKILGGFYIKARKIKNSPIHRMPPYVREIWDYCLREANHSDASYHGFFIKRGQLFRTYKDIREDLSWYIGYRKMMYNENHTKKAMKALREALMIDTTKELGGVLITVLNYDHYQNPENYERTDEITDESTTIEPSKNHPIPANNKKKEKKENKLNTNTAFCNAENAEEFFLTRKKRKLSGKRLGTFNLFWEAFNYRKGKAEAADSWLDIPMLTDRLVSEICDAARKEAAKRPELITQGRTPKMAQGWLTARRWEDEITQLKGDDGSQKALALRSKTEQLLKEMEV